VVGTVSRMSHSGEKGPFGSLSWVKSVQRRIGDQLSGNRDKSLPAGGMRDVNAVMNDIEQNGTERNRTGW
jgi:hypothetical protein